MSELLNRTLGENIHIETVLAAGLWTTLVDANQLENALINLGVNARDAMPDGGKLTIETSNTYLDEGYARRFGDVEAGQYALLSVSDTGTGMAPEVLAHAFEPFFTTKPTGQGTGLGLATVHGFAKQSKGHVRVYSELGQGTTVKLYLPRLMQEEGAAAPAGRVPAGPATLRSEKRETILLVEDNAGVRTFARETLADLGYNVIDAPSGEAALDLLRGKQDVDLLLTDVVLPGMTGRQLADRLAADRPRLRILFTTGYTRNAIIHEGRLDAGVNLLTKPFAQTELASKVRDLLDAPPHTR
jgi:CheY-like chemotaxis protein